VDGGHEHADDCGGRRFLVTLAVDRYPDLPGEPGSVGPATYQAKQVSDLLGAYGYDTALRMGSYWSAEQVRTSLRHWAADAELGENDVVAFYFSGRCSVDGGQHFLDCWGAGAGNGPTDTAVATEEITSLLIDSGVRSLLIVLDAHHAPEGAGTALLGIARRAGGAHAATIWILWGSTCGDPLAETLRGGLTDSAGRTGQRQRFLDLADVTAALNQRYAAADSPQRAQLTIGTAAELAPFFANPGYREHLPREDTDLELQRRFVQRELQDHFGPRSRGVDWDSEQGLYFRGRARALDELVDWLSAARSGGHGRVVTGSPGCGKSAVLGRIVAMSDPAYRSWLLQQPDAPGSAVRAGLVDVAVHARHKRLPEIVEQVAAGLGLPGSSTGELLREITLAGRSRATPFVIVVDALDEAGSGTAADTGGKGEPRRVARELLRPLFDIPAVRLLVGTRPELLSSLGAAPRILNLDDPGYLGEHDIAEYVATILLADGEPDVLTPYRGRPQLARHVAEAVAARADRVFLVARMTARSLRAEDKPVDVTQPGWQERLPSEIGQAFEDYLARYGPDEPRVRALLQPLAFAEGKGLPRSQLWTDLAGALSGGSYADEDLDWLLSKAQAYLAEVTDAGRSAYRLYHQSLAEHLRASYRGEAHTRIVPALLTLVPVAANGPDYLSAPPYVRRHLATHAAAAGTLDDLVDDPGFLLAAEQLALLRALPTVTTRPARQIRSAYEQAAHQLVGTAPVGERAAYLQLSAHRCGADTLAARIDALGVPMPWHSRWAWWSTTGVHRQLVGHTEPILAVAIGDLDGQPIAVTGAADKTCRIWDLTTQRQWGPALRPGCEAVTAVAMGELDDYTILVTGGDDGALQVWDLSSGNPLGDPLRGHTNAITSVALLIRDSRTLAVSASRDGSARLWDLSAGKQLGNPMRAHRSAVHAIGLVETEGMHLVITGGGDNRARVWDLATGEEIREPLIGHLGAVKAIGATSIDGQPVVVTGSKDGTIGVWDLQTRRQLGEPLPAHSSTSGGVQALAAGSIADVPVAVSGGRDFVRLWNLATGQQVGQQLAGHYGDVNAVAMGTVDRTPVAVTAGQDQVARVWDLNADRPLLGHTGDVRTAAIGTVRGHCHAITGSSDTTAVVWDLTAEQGVQNGPALIGHKGAVTAALLGELSERPVAITGSEDCTARLWDLDTMRALGMPLYGHDAPITALALFAVDGSPVLATGSSDGTVRLWDPARAHARGAALVGHNADVDQLACCDLQNDHGPLILAMTVRGPVSAWTARDGRPVAVSPPAVERWSALAVADCDGRPVVLAAGPGNVLQLWDLLTGRPAGPRMSGHTTYVTHAAIHQGSARLLAATADDQGELLLWDLHTGTQLGPPIPGGRYSLNVVAVCDEVVATVSLEQTRVWSTTDLHQRGDALTGRSTDICDMSFGSVHGRRVLVGAGWQDATRVFDLASGNLVGPVLNSRIGAFRGVAVIELSGALAVTADGHETATVTAWDLESRRQRYHWVQTGMPHAAVCARHRRRPLAIVAIDSTVHIWDLEDRASLGQITGHTGGVMKLCVADVNGISVLLTGSQDGTARLWDLDTLAPLGPPLTIEDEVLTAATVQAVDGVLTAYTGHRDGMIRAWDPITGVSRAGSAPALDHTIYVLHTGQMHGQQVLMAADERTIRLWSIADNVEIAEIQLGLSPQDIQVTDDGYLCISTVMGIATLHIPDRRH
jgi:WD40 repeat protein